MQYILTGKVDPKEMIVSGLANFGCSEYSRIKSLNVTPKSLAAISDKAQGTGAYSFSKSGASGFEGGSKVDFYVTPSGEAVPATGYRYMSSEYATEALTTGKQYTTYIGFTKYDSAAAARDAFQVTPTWSDCKVRGTFDTLQAIDDMYIPTTLGNTTSIREPFTVSYPQYGKGGIQQLRVDKLIEFKDVKIIGD